MAHLQLKTLTAECLKADCWETLNGR